MGLGDYLAVLVVVAVWEAGCWIWRKWHELQKEKV
jgi:hypothetical protein